MTISPLDSNLPELPELALSCDGILNRSYYLYQPKQGYRFGTDAMVLAAAIGPHYGTRFAEFGAGAGAVSVALSHFCPEAHITAIEKEPNMAACLRHNVALNQLTEKIRPYEADITQLPALFEESFDCVIANPPFHHPAGTRSRNARRALAHHGDSGAGIDEVPLEAWVTAGLRALKKGGRLSLILRADRADDVIISLREQGAGSISLRPIYPYKSSPAIRVILSARKAVQSPFSVLDGLVLHHPDGALTAHANQIFSGAGAGLLSVPNTSDTKNKTET